MKHTRRLASLLLALVMVFALAATAFAAEVDSGKGGPASITISNALAGENYNFTIVFAAVPGEDGTISYKLLEGDTLPENDYFAKDIAGNITAKDAAKDASGSLTPNAINWIKEVTGGTGAVLGSEVYTATATEDGALTVTGLPYGYYYIDTTTGVLVTVDSTTPNAIVNDKNEPPTIEKKIWKNGELNNDIMDGDLVDEDTASIGDTITYLVKIDFNDITSQTIKFHDTMSDGLTYNDDMVILKSDFTQYQTVEPEECDCCDISITWRASSVAMMHADLGGSFYLKYSATLNEHAVIAGNGNTNEADLTYGNEQRIESIPVITKTYSLDLVKTDSNNKLLTGAEFELYADASIHTPVKLIETSPNNYRVATNDPNATNKIVVKNAEKVVITGLGNAPYRLIETKAPAGYNQLTAPIPADIEDANLEATIELDTYIEGGVQVINNAGSELPSTGGMGTTLFYIVGGFMVMAAVVLLVTKKRMTAE